MKARGRKIKRVVIEGQFAPPPLKSEISTNTNPSNLVVFSNKNVDEDRVRDENSETDRDVELKLLAEREGFEPPLRFPVNLISSQAPSAARPPLPDFQFAFTRSQA